jgi:acyl carrier protein
MKTAINNVENEVYEILARVAEIPKDDLLAMDKGAPLFTSGLNLGSLKVVELIFELEQSLGIEFQDDDISIKNIDTIDLIISLAKKRL